MRAGRTALLDAVRGLAVVAVVAYHCFTLTVVEGRPEGTVGPGWWVAGAGSLGVDLFFVLSGFLLAGSWERLRRRHSGGLGPALRQYFRNRALRILPAYWLSLAVLLPLAAPGLLSTPEGLGRFALLATLQGYLVKELPGQVNLVYWSMTTEVHFYLVLPAVAWALRRCGARLLLPVCVLAAVAWRLWAPGGLPDSWLIGRLDQFVAGMAAAGLVAAADAGRRSPLVDWLATRQAAWLCGAGLVAVGLYHGSRFSVDRPQALAVLVHPLAGLLIAALLVRVLLADRPVGAVTSGLEAIGVVSFSLYLWHYPVISQGVRWLGLHQPRMPAPAVIAGLTVLVAISVALAVASYRMVERPFLARKPVPGPARTPLPVPAAAPAGLSLDDEWVGLASVAGAGAAWSGPVTPRGR